MVLVLGIVAVVGTEFVVAYGATGVELLVTGTLVDGLGLVLVGVKACTSA